MITGVVKSYNAQTGFGFISIPGNDSLFVHYTAIEGSGYREIKAGQHVSCVVVDGLKGPQAAKVTIIDEN
ncbi:cold-shock protein [Secundilactobacillus malefermentans]|uniref:CSD domain-containing protein n=1 Tax=Secundilactobacillus malefermentans TaxID=176292 RepID=A0A4V3A4J7_9LACO|nr:cold shock domain-containing protein [Secundilactobacillus malefermentans]QEA30875.1 cold-shock protein [Secundilactobacillus malefermentans]TDG80669.1 hypothetical protein C5L31_001245 [Secundilactobacillus malefermentans]